MLNNRITKNQTVFFKILVYVSPFLGGKGILEICFFGWNEQTSDSTEQRNENP